MSLPDETTRKFTAFMVANNIGYQAATRNSGPIFTGFLNLRAADIDALPKGLKVQGSLCISDTFMDQLPEGLVISGSLIAGSSGLTSLPQDLQVMGDINLHHSPISHLPRGFSVPGFLNLNGSWIEELPEGLDVGHDLSIEHTRIQRFPRDMRVGGIIHPPQGLLDIRTFMLGRRSTVTLARPATRHDDMALRASLEHLPDLLRIVLSLPPGGSLDLAPPPAPGLSPDRVLAHGP